jgi:hypothetical protein
MRYFLWDDQASLGYKESAEAEGHQGNGGTRQMGNESEAERLWKLHRQADQKALLDAMEKSAEQGRIRQEAVERERTAQQNQNFIWNDRQG